jgi:hypothetical protein
MPQTQELSARATDSPKTGQRSDAAAQGVHTQRRRALSQPSYGPAYLNSARASRAELSQRLLRAPLVAVVLAVTLMAAGRVALRRLGGSRPRSYQSSADSLRAETRPSLAHHIASKRAAAAIVHGSHARRPQRISRATAHSGEDPGAELLPCRPLPPRWPTTPTSRLTCRPRNPARSRRRTRAARRLTAQTATGDPGRPLPLVARSSNPHSPRSAPTARWDR